jgi:hypothetical protein
MTECYCPYDPPTVFNAQEHRARKTYRCGECGCDIRPGERYERVFGVWDGIADTNLTCERCVDFRKWLAFSLPCFCWCYENMLEDARETISEAMLREHVPGFAFEAGRKLVAIRRRALADMQARWQQRRAA